MKKLVLVLVVLMFTAPAWAAATVTITAAQIPDTNNVQLSYSTDANLPRAFALEISITSNLGDYVTVVEVDPNNLSSDYYIYPGSIVIVGGVVQDYGTPAAAQDANSMILEMGSLYDGADLEHPDPPASDGPLCIINLGGCGNAVLTIAENAERGGVVMEDPDEEPIVVLNGCSVVLPICEVWCDQFIFPGCNNPDPNTEEFDLWREVGEPNCWSYPRQCHGDADGRAEGGSKAGYWHVGIQDLNTMVAGWKVKEPAVAPTPSGPGIATITYNGPNESIKGICADFGHSAEGGSKAGYWHVGIDDLNRLVASWKVKEPAVAPTPSGPGVDSDCGGTLEPPPLP